MSLIQWVSDIKQVPDKQTWYAKVDTRKAEPTAIIKYETRNGVNVLVLVRLSGVYHYDKRFYSRTDEGAHVKLSMNGTAHLTFAELDDLRDVINEARAELANYHS